MSDGWDVTMTHSEPDCVVTWREFYHGIECEAAAAASRGQALAWTFDTPDLAVAVIDEAGSWAYAVAKEGQR